MTSAAESLSWQKLPVSFCGREASVGQRSAHASQPHSKLYFLSASRRFSTGAEAKVAQYVSAISSPSEIGFVAKASVQLPWLTRLYSDGWKVRCKVA